jgi:hypothetical protein
MHIDVVEFSVSICVINTEMASSLQCLGCVIVKQMIKGTARCMKLPLCAGFGEGSDHLGSMYAAFPCKFLQEAVSTT